MRIKTWLFANVFLKADSRGNFKRIPTNSNVKFAKWHIKAAHLKCFKGLSLKCLINKRRRHLHMLRRPTLAIVVRDSNLLLHLWPVTAKIWRFFIFSDDKPSMAIWCDSAYRVRRSFYLIMWKVLMAALSDWGKLHFVARQHYW